MGFSGTVIRVSVPSATLYWTWFQGLWSPSVGSVESARIFQEHKSQVGSWVSQGLLLAKPYTHPVFEEGKKLAKQVTGVRCLYNSGVKSTFRTLYSFDACRESKRLYSWISSQLTTTVEKTTSPPSEKSEGKN